MVQNSVRGGAAAEGQLRPYEPVDPGPPALRRPPSVASPGPATRVATLCYAPSAPVRSHAYATLPQSKPASPPRARPAGACARCVCRRLRSPGLCRSGVARPGRHVHLVASDRQSSLDDHRLRQGLGLRVRVRPGWQCLAVVCLGSAGQHRHPLWIRPGRELRRRCGVQRAFLEHHPRLQSRCADALAHARR